MVEKRASESAGADRVVRPASNAGVEKRAFRIAVCDPRWVPNPARQSRFRRVLRDPCHARSRLLAAPPCLLRRESQVQFEHLGSLPTQSPGCRLVSQHSRLARTSRALVPQSPSNAFTSTRTFTPSRLDSQQVWLAFSSEQQPVCNLVRIADHARGSGTSKTACS